MNVRLAALDTTASTRLRTLPHAPAVDRFLAAASRVTDHARGWYVLGTVGAALDTGRRSQWITATATVAVTETLSQRIKDAVGRARPQVRGLPHLASTPSPLSFPSAHTADGVAAALTFGRLMPTIPLTAVAVIQAASRPYLGVHFVSDVLGGALLGAIVGSVGRLTMKGATRAG